MSDKIMFYGSPVCGMVPPVRGVLDRAGASYEYVDISQDGDARQRVREINGGIESVPTLEFPDDSTLTEPALSELEEKLSALGLEAGPLFWGDRLVLLLESQVVRLMAIGLASIGVLAREAWLFTLGLVILALSIAAGLWRRKNL